MFLKVSKACFCDLNENQTEGEKKDKYLPVICLYCLLFQLLNEICSTLGCQQDLVLVET